MLLFSKKKAVESNEPIDLDAVMKKFDRESNTRIWEGKAKVVVNCVLAAFSLFCIYVTFFATWLDAIRLSSFVGCLSPGILQGSPKPSSLLFSFTKTQR